MTKLQTYREYSPTTFDRKGLNCPDHQSWLVAPVILTRDSNTLEECNYEVAEAQLAEADPHGADHTELSFGHWACGWFRIMLVKPGTQAAKTALNLKCMLEEYPILCEDAYSAAEADAHDDDACDEHCSLCEGERQDHDYGDCNRGCRYCPDERDADYGDAKRAHMKNEGW